MNWLEDEQKTVNLKEMLEQIEEIQIGLRLEYLEMLKSYDEAMGRIAELEEDKIYLEELLEEATNGGMGDGL